MTAYRFVHAADVHLDSPLRSLALRDPRLAEFVGNASRQVFCRIVDLCLDEQVNALLLAGDLYDGEQTSMKTARFTSVLDDGSITAEERVVSLAQFERVAVDASEVASWPELAARLEKALGEAAGRSASDHVVARLAVSGATPMAWNIRRDADLLRTEAEARAETIGNVWVEKIDIDCRRPVVDSESADPVEALRRTMSDEIVGSEAFRTEADGIVNDLLSQLPPECRRSLAPDDTGLDLLIGRLGSEGSEEVLARLAAGSAQEAR